MLQIFEATQLFIIWSGLIEAAMDWRAPSLSRFVAKVCFDLQHEWEDIKIL